MGIYKLSIKNKPQTVLWHTGKASFHVNIMQFSFPGVGENFPDGVIYGGKWVIIYFLAL